MYFNLESLSDASSWLQLNILEGVPQKSAFLSLPFKKAYDDGLS